MTAALAGGLLVLAAVAVVGDRGPRSRLRRLRSGNSVRSVLTDAVRKVLRRADVSQRLAVFLATAVSFLLGTAWHGVVAGTVAAGYGGLAAYLTLRRRATTRQRRRLVDALDGVASLAADLRAGVPPNAALGAALPLLVGARGRSASACVDDLLAQNDTSPRGRVLDRVAAAWTLAETTGAPLSDVLDHLDVEVRHTQRVRALAMAQTASARATAVLLAALPLAGIVLGYGMGADPLAVLFTTPVGAVCALTAVTLQLVGLAWSHRLTQVDAERVELPGEER